MRTSYWILAPAVATGILLLVAAAGSREGSGEGVTFTRVDLGEPTDHRASTGGASLVDVDADGDLDLFVTNGYDVSAPTATPQDDRLYLNDGRGSFVTVEDGPMIAEAGFGSGHTWGDYDNDGHLDVFVAQQRGQDNLLYRNDGDGGFTRILEGPPVTDGGVSYVATWVDIDSDGWLDLYVANGGLSSAATNFLYRNLGDGSFERVTEGPLVADTAAHAGLAWGDYDDDGDPDLFIARNHSSATLTSALYRNEGNWRFTRVTGIPPVTDTMPALGAAWGDHDNDGDLDLTVAVRSGWADRVYRNDGNGRFTRILEGPLALDGTYSSSAVWLDYDNDGDLDLLRSTWGSPSYLYTNLRGGRFERRDHGDLGRAFTHSGGNAIGDYDDDGDLDIFEGNWPNWPGENEKAHLYRNDAPAAQWVGIRLVGTLSNRAGIGARVTVRARIDGREVTQMRELFPNTGFRTHQPVRLHFGLGDAVDIDQVTIRWPSGIVQHLHGAAATQWITITEAS